MRMGIARLLGFTALVAAEWVRGIGLVAAGALTYGLMGGTMPAPGGFDQPVAIAAFLTIALGAIDLLLAALFAATALRLRALNLPADRPVNLQAAWSAARFSSKLTATVSHALGQPTARIPIGAMRRKPALCRSSSLSPPHNPYS